MRPELTPFEQDIYKVICKYYGEPFSGVKNISFKKDILTPVYKASIAFALIRTHGNQLRAARVLKINRNTLGDYAKCIKGNLKQFITIPYHLHSIFLHKEE